MVNTMDKTTSYGVQDYVCDTADDLTDLPTDVPAGSTAFVIATSKAYMLNSSGEWKEI